MHKVLLKGCRIIDINHPEPSDACHILIENGIIAKISAQPIQAKDLIVIDCDDHYLLPGFIDAHVHVSAARASVANLSIPNSEIILRAKEFMEEMVQRGFTTIRDAGGADYELAHALSMGLIKGPRLFYSGKALSQTGGHGDFRDGHDHFQPCFCHQAASNISMVADGVPAVQKAAREQLRRGASQIKIMASGGVNSPNDKIESVQYSLEEIQAVVNVARDQGTYVMAHAYTPHAIQRCVKAGVRSIEHGNLLDERTAKMMADNNAALVPTLIVYQAMADLLAESKYLADDVIEKFNLVSKKGLRAIEIAKYYGVDIGFGSDLLGNKAHPRQAEEFTMQAKVQTCYETLISATAINAKILNQENKLGVIKVGAYADIVLSQQNPLDNIDILATDKNNIKLVIRHGEVMKNLLK